MQPRAQLLLTHGHDLGEPHWQILNDGRLFFSVKEDEPRRRKVKKHPFYSPPIWSAARNGQWLMLAVTFDREAKQVTHYLNGTPLSTEAIPEENLAATPVLNIGNASIGNWSEPAYRQDAEFAVRNLNGSMDEFMMFSAALSADEIKLFNPAI